VLFVNHANHSISNDSLTPSPDVWLRALGAGDFNEAGDTFVLRLGELGLAPRLLTLRLAWGGPVTIVWTAEPGRTYRVQFKDDLNAAEWADLPGAVTATGPTASHVDPQPSPSHRFYRVVLMP